MARVLTERVGRTWVVTLNRPEVRNCVDGETARALRLAVEEFRRDDSLRVTVLYPQTSLLRDRQAVLEGLSLPLPAGLALGWRLHQRSLRSPEMQEGLRRYRSGDRPPPPTATA